MPDLPKISGKDFVELTVKYGFHRGEKFGQHMFLYSPKMHFKSIITLYENERISVSLLKLICEDLWIDEYILESMLKEKKAGVDLIRLDRMNH